MTMKLLILFLTCLTAGIFSKDEIIPEDVCICKHELTQLSDKVSYSASESEFCAPRQVNVANTQRVKTLAKRNNASQRTGYFIFKGGKPVNRTSISLFISTIHSFPSGFDSSDHHLISLRKLII